MPSFLIRALNVSIHSLTKVNSNMLGIEVKSESHPSPRTSHIAAHTRSTSVPVIAGNSGKVTMRRPTLSATGNMPSRKPRSR